MRRRDHHQQPGLLARSECPLERGDEIGLALGQLDVKAHALEACVLDGLDPDLVRDRVRVRVRVRVRFRVRVKIRVRVRVQG